MKSMIRNFVEKEVDPYARQIEEEDAILQHLVEKTKEIDGGTNDIQRLIIARKVLEGC